ncbi:hypothetical protein FOA52_003261, partial [Chlamydomonas sp. UWO 241]
HEGDKRGGAGRGNWGKDGEEAKAEDSEVKTEAPAGEEAAVEAPATPAVEEEKEMSLEEYETQLAEKKAALNKKAAVKEGFKAFERTTTEDEVTGVELANKKAIEEKVAKVKAAKAVVKVETGFKIETAEEKAPVREFGGRGGRGGRGEGRGEGRGGGRGGDRPFSGRGEGRGRGGEGRGPRPEGGRGEGGGRGRGDGRGPRPERSDRPEAPRPERPAGGRGGGAAIAIDDTAAFPSLG